MILTPSEGLIIIAAYALFVIAITYFFTAYSKRKIDFLLAGRKAKIGLAAFSIAASWIWAPALFVSAQKAYTDGFAGLFWFTVPNAAAVLLFGYVAVKLRKRFKNGYTLPQFMWEKTSKRVHNLYLVQFLSLNVCAFSVQLLAGGGILAYLTGVPMSYFVLIFAIIALSYSMYSGLRASMVTDYVQMLFMLVAAFIIVPIVYLASPDGALLAGMRGPSGDMLNIFSLDSLWVAYSFGIVVSIGLLSGSFGDQIFWQRGLAIEKDSDVRKAFVMGAGIFVIAPVMMGMLGFLARGSGVDVPDVGYTNLFAILPFVEKPIIILFVGLIISGLISTLDSVLASASSLAGNDIYKRLLGVTHSHRTYDDQALVASRASMVMIALVGIAIALIPGMTIALLFLFYGTLRASTLAPTLYTIMSKKRVSEKGVFYGLVASIFVFVPIFGYANFTGMTHLAVAGSILTVSSSGILAYYFTQKQTVRPKYKK